MASSVCGMHQKKNISRAVLVRRLTCSALALAGVLVLTVVCARFETKATNGDLIWKKRSLPEVRPQTKVDGRFQFLFHMNKSKISNYQGGGVQWAGYKSNRNDYLNPEEVEFGNYLNSHQSQMSLGTLRIKGGGLRVPNWNLNSNLHGFVAQGTVWIGVIDDYKRPVSYTVTTGNVIFLPRNTLYWIKNIGRADCLIVMFLTKKEKPSFLDLDDLFFSTPKDLLANMFEHQGGMKFIEQLKRPLEDQSINLPPNLSQLTKATTYQQSESAMVRQYCFELEGTSKVVYRGGAEMQWSWDDSNQACLNEDQKIFSASLLQYPDSLNVGKLRLPAGACLLPHHVNANQMGYVLTGCGKVGVLGTETNDFEIGVGAALFFPTGAHYYINNTCTEDLTVVLAYSFCEDQNRCGYRQSTRQLADAVFLDEYFDSIPPNVLAQTFLTNENSFTNIFGGSRTKIICSADTTGKRISTVAPHQSIVANRVTLKKEGVVNINSGAITNNSNKFGAVTPKQQVPLSDSNEDESVFVDLLGPDAVNPPKDQVPPRGSNEDNESVFVDVLATDAVNPPKDQGPPSGSNEDNESVFVDVLDPEAVKPPKHQVPSSDFNEDESVNVEVLDPGAVKPPEHHVPPSDVNEDDTVIVEVLDADAVNPPKHQVPPSDSNEDDDSVIVEVLDPGAVNPPKHHVPPSDANEDDTVMVEVLDADAVNPPKHQVPPSDSNEDDDSVIVEVLDRDAVNPPKH